jgi:tetratricopeptide (TPR) repeat protein
MTAHLTEEQLRRLVQDPPRQEDFSSLVQHLLDLCPDCTAAARRWDDEEAAEGDSSASDATAIAAYEAVFDRLFSGVAHTGQELARERLTAAHRWIELWKEPQTRRLALVASRPQFQTLGVYERALETARLWRHQPAISQDAALLAVSIAEHLDPGRHGRRWIANLRGAAFAELGNVQRIFGDFRGALESFTRARQILATGTGDPLESANTLNLEASLMRDLGRFEDSIHLLDQAFAIYELLEDSHQAGRTLLMKATAHGLSEPLEGIAMLERSMTMIDVSREPFLGLAARHNLADFLCEAGRPWEALSLLQATGPLYYQFGENRVALRRQWVEGKIALGLGERETARGLLEDAGRGFLEAGLHHEFVLCSLTLAETHFLLGHWQQAVELASQVLELLTAWGMHDDGLAVWLLLRKAFQERRDVRRTSFRKIAAYTYRSWNVPTKLPELALFE